MEDRLALVVADWDVRRMLRESLRIAGYRVMEATRSEESFPDNADLVFLDPGTVEEGALELMARVFDENPGAEVVVVSTPEMIAHSLPRGACEYLPKPFGCWQVRQVLERLHRQRLLERRQRLLETEAASLRGRVEWLTASLQQGR